MPLPGDAVEAGAVLEEFRPVFTSERIEKIGHNLKFDLGALQWRGLAVGGKLFDAMIAHSLIEPDMRHSLEYLSEVFLGYSLSQSGGDAKEEPSGPTPILRKYQGIASPPEPANSLMIIALGPAMVSCGS